MAFKYKNPTTVVSPKKKIKNVTVIYYGGNTHGRYSIAKLKWNKQDAIGVRWNINENESVDPAKMSA